ncbi:hypothetical protein SAMN00017405_1065 [Desulfonispora thiosulfatigenes DSM 11270]|uniref:Uncharacterized protein n=1 Tax=Desulfonispora thiosulfatigenes DSM 11270 TaxID=656914 RepID=A0A1W1UR67_DESTI|nr:hypothetical protein [Desulfonispora thiosulfatigenes]SMB83602.1 hypothetical protein SAMN00017405_1065 [Desulfonispora thiosulfatigenes DSM 11270]
MKKRWLIIGGVLLIIVASTLTARMSDEKRSTVNLQEYTLTDLPITLSIPATTTVKEDIIEDKREVVFSSYLNDKKLNYWGHIQVWNVDNLEKFLDSSKSTSVYNFIEYTKERIKINNLEGFLVKWTATFQNDRTITSQEYFLKKEGSKEVLRISFLVNGDKIDQGLHEVIKQVIASVKWAK